MRKLLLAIMLSVPLSALADNPCVPNLINEDMCVVAKSIESELKKSIPIKVNERMNITDAKADITKVTVTTAFIYNQDEYKEILNNDDKLIAKTKDIVKKMGAKSSCSNKALNAFINLGGVVEYDYVFSDGSRYETVTITSCD